jgi:hypothetical protein
MSDTDRKIVRLARVLQSAMHEILAAVGDLEPAELAVGLRETEPLRRISRRLDDYLAEFDRLQELSDRPACRGPRCCQLIRDGRLPGHVE